LRRRLYQGRRDSSPLKRAYRHLEYARKITILDFGVFEPWSFMAYIQGEAAIKARCFRSLLTTLFLSIICAASSLHSSQSLRYQSSVSSVLSLRRQEDSQAGSRACPSGLTSLP